jgi:uncharacterized protein YggU (UPF0235/DUF167 family)
VTAKPHQGAANEALIDLLARALGVAPSRLRLAAGVRSRSKVVGVFGIDPAAVARRWPGLLA